MCILSQSKSAFLLYTKNYGIYPADEEALGLGQKPRCVSAGSSWYGKFNCALFLETVDDRVSAAAIDMNT